MTFSHIFQPPEEALPWTGMWNASNEHEECIQIVRGSDDVVGAEDCLYLNIHTPHVREENRFSGPSFQNKSLALERENGSGALPS